MTGMDVLDQQMLWLQRYREQQLLKYLHAHEQAVLVTVVWHR